jgi:hypothetical protein
MSPWPREASLIDHPSDPAANKLTVPERDLRPETAAGAATTVLEHFLASRARRAR